MKIFYFLATCIFLFFHYQGNSADYFWVGGSGDWSEISHWATASGGNVKYAVTPSAADNVIFDENSFPGSGAILTINNDIAFALNLTFRNITTNPTFRAGANTTLNIYGNLTLIPQMTFQFGGNIHFLGTTTARTINFANHNAGSNVMFNGSGNWSLMSNLIVGNLLEINQGNISFGNNQVTTQFFKSNSTLPKLISFDNASIRVTGTSVYPNIFWLQDPNNKFTVHINTTNWTSTSNGARMELTSPFNHIFVHSNGNIVLPQILASSAVGTTMILNDQQLARLTINGDLDIRHDGVINSSLTAQNLILTPGFDYTLLGGGVYSINSIISTGTCSSMASLNTNPVGMPASINLTAPTNLAFTVLQDMKLSGAPATANNSINLGNNSGITITEKNSQTLYWIGRTGNWSNPANWSLTSGGVPSGCLPSLIDDVVFDANSFNANGQIVTLNTLNSFCKNMTWTSNVRQDATMAGRDSIRLNINGSLEFSAPMKQDYKGDVFFIGTGQHTLKVAGKKFNADLIFNNPAGIWRLMDDIYVEKINYLRSGKLVFENISCNYNRFYADFTTSRAMELKNSELNFEVRNNFCATFNMNAVSLQLDPGKSHIHFRNSGCSGMYIGGQADISFHNITSGCSHFYISNSWFSHKVNINHFKILKSAEINLQSTIDSLTVTGGQEINFGNQAKLTVNNIIANNPCNSYVNMSMTEWLNSDNNFNPTIILSKPHTFTRFSLSDIVVQGSVPVVLSQSIDRGGNIGWQFSNTTGRTLYWVGGSGDWDEQIHWSLTSGGPGGECIPTENDDVIFDARSFNSNTDFVTYGRNANLVAFCKNLTFNVPGFTGSLTLNILKIYGNLSINQAINYNIFRTEFHNHTGVQTVFAPSIKFEYFTIGGKSEVKLLSPIHIEYDLRCTDGVFNTDGFDMVVGFKCYFGNFGIRKKPLIKFRTSNVEIKGSNQQYNEPLSCYRFLKLEGDSSRINLSNNSTAMAINSPECKFGEIIASSITGTADIASYQNTSIRKLILRGDGKFINFQNINNIGALTLDTLILSAGKSYNYAATYTQTINKHLQARGNNCNPISIFSSISGQKGIISMPASASINMDFVQMKDMRGIGGAIFNAGPYSTNINNSNENWTFPGVTSITESVGFLGPDRLICPGMNGVVLDANSFTPTETYRWSNGSTAATLNAQNTGNYAVTVTFANSCKVIDTITVTKGQDIGKILPKDTSLCNQNAFTINPLINDPLAKYTWSTGATSQQLSVTNNGKYNLEFTKDGCSFRDSVQISFINLQAINLGRDTTLCQPNTIVLNLQSAYPLIRWQDGSSNQVFTASNTGLYWVEVGSDQCKVRDSVSLVFNPLPVFNLGPDTTLCSLRSTLILTTGNEPGTTTWQDGSSGNNFTVRSGNTYSAVKTLNGCNYSDTIEIRKIGIGFEESITRINRCDGHPFYSAGYVYENATFKWSPGLTPSPANFTNFIPIGEKVTFTKSGIYWVDIEWNGCTVRDSFDINFKALPVFSLGNDTSICQGSSTVLSHGVTNAQTQWSNGNTSSTITAQTSGKYFAKVTKDGCSYSDTIDINVKPLPLVNLGADTILCENTTLNLNTGSGPGTVVWSNNTTLPQITVTAAGQYSATKTLDGCSKSDTINVSYVSLQKPFLGMDTSFCDGNSVTLRDITATPNVKYLWSDGNTAAIINANKTGIYWLETAFSQCKKRDTINLNVLPLPKISSPKDYNFCEGKDVAISIQGDFDNIRWADFPNQQNIVVSAAKAYKYTATKGRCDLLSEVNVRQVVIPDPAIGDYIDLCRGEVLKLSVPDFGGIAKWSTGTQAKSIQVITSGNYYVTMTEAGCTKSDTVFVGFFDCNGDFLYFPNIINTRSTNGNEKFFPTLAEKYNLTEYKLSIYDRYGNLLFVSDDIDNHWDGLRIGSIELQPGVYTYICTASANGPKKFDNKRFTGTVTLLK
jgi:hypothetical protein